MVREWLKTAKNKIKKGRSPSNSMSTRIRAKDENSKLDLESNNSNSTESDSSDVDDRVELNPTLPDIESNSIPESPDVSVSPVFTSPRSPRSSKSPAPPPPRTKELPSTDHIDITEPLSVSEHSPDVSVSPVFVAPPPPRSSKSPAPPAPPPRTKDLPSTDHIPEPLSVSEHSPDVIVSPRSSKSPAPPAPPRTKELPVPSTDHIDIPEQVSISEHSDSNSIDSNSKPKEIISVSLPESQTLHQHESETEVIRVTSLPLRSGSVGEITDKPSRDNDISKIPSGDISEKSSQNDTPTPMSADNLIDQSESADHSELEGMCSIAIGNLPSPPPSLLELCRTEE